MSTLTPVEYSFITPHTLGIHYRQICNIARLDPTPRGWGLLYVKDANGEHWTIATDDAPWLRMAIEAGPTIAGMTIPEDKFPIKRHGWPDEWRHQ